MDEEKNRNRVLLVDDEEIFEPLQWQQAQYHQLQSLSTALIGAILTILAILGTAYTSGILDFPTLPESGPPPGASDLGLLSELGLSALYGWNALMLTAGILMLLVMGTHGGRRLIDIVSGPQLYPRIESEVVTASKLEGSLREDTSSKRFRDEILASVNENARILEVMRHYFYGGFFRVIIWFFIAGTLYVLFTKVATGGTLYLIGLDMTVGLPVSVIGIFWKRYSNEPPVSEPDQPFGHALFEAESSRFPEEFDTGEGFLAGLTYFFALFGLLTVVLDVAF